jgi:chemotaxis receptor (MCP) glutamine deamidase CheD
VSPITFQGEKIEAGVASVSLDLLVRSLLAMGASNSDLAKIIAGSHRLAERPLSDSPLAKFNHAIMQT